MREHINVSDKPASGLRALPDNKSGFASTQAAWRFYQNDTTCLRTLSSPLLSEAHAGMDRQSNRYALVMSDWSRVAYGKHTQKLDTLCFSNKYDIGYELQSSLLVSDQDGSPIVPIVQNLVTKNGVWSSYHDERIESMSHLDELTNRMAWIERQNFPKPRVYLVDREADSVKHMRIWATSGYEFIIRANNRPSVEYKGKSQQLYKAAEQLTYTACREVDIKGKRGIQWIAEAQVILTRSAQQQRYKEGKRISRSEIKGEPLALRLIVSRILDSEDKILAEWLLLSNVQAADAQTLALWYYWRWRIESFFKLLKQAGHQLESWQQTDGLAIAKRLLVASMACVVVWQLAAGEQPETKRIQCFLVKLSGRQMKRGKPATHPALLAGLWQFLSMLEVLKYYSPNDLYEIGNLLLSASPLLAKLMDGY